MGEERQPLKRSSRKGEGLYVSTVPEKIREIIIDLEKIKIWEPSHRLPFVKHNWIPLKAN